MSGCWRCTAPPPQLCVRQDAGRVDTKWLSGSRHPLLPCTGLTCSGRSWRLAYAWGSAAMRGSCRGMRPSPQAALGPTLNCSPGLGWRTEAMLWSPPAIVHGSAWVLRLCKG